MNFEPLRKARAELDRLHVGDPYYSKVAAVFDVLEGLIASLDERVRANELDVYKFEDKDAGTDPFTIPRDAK